MSEFKVEVIQQGNGPLPKRGDKVTVHYTGKLANGQVFDSSVQRGQPFVFTLGQGQVIAGWDQGVAQLNVGTKALLTCPPNMAYGARGIPPIIPANATLFFEVELLKIN